MQAKEISGYQPPDKVSWSLWRGVLRWDLDGYGGFE